MNMATAPKTTTEADEVVAPAAPEGENKSSLPEAQRPPGDLRRRGRKEKRKGPFVKYVGSASHRQIEPADWGTLNIDLKDKKATHNWSIANDKMLEADQFSDDQLDYLLIDDLQQGSGAHAFLLMDYNDAGELVQAVYE